MAELILGIRSRASLAPRFCTSIYLKGNPGPLGTEIYVLVPGGFAGKCGLIMARKLSITSIQKLSIRFLIGPAPFPGVIPWWELRAPEQNRYLLILVIIDQVISRD